jgi:diguanylate cyclase (GGDEF)-like protein
VAALAARDDIERLKLALASAGEVAFDWAMADDAIEWDGALDILAIHSDPDRLQLGAALRAWMGRTGREELDAVIREIAFKERLFEIEFEAASAMGTVWFEMRGVRLPSFSGTAERLCGTLHIVTERKREMRRLNYLATRDELTGLLNRTSLRAELSRAIEGAKAENRSCAYLVTAIDRLAMINEAYGFGAADEVIVAVGERLAGALKATDIVGRTAGNKFGVVLNDCNDHEMVLVADRLRAMVRGDVIETCAGTVSATISVGGVFLPSGASSSQEAMLRAEEALQRARSAGRDGFAAYAKSPQREMARLRLMTIADNVVAALNSGNLVFAYQPIVGARSRKPRHYECLLRMLKPDGSVVTAGQFIPAAEQLGIVRLVDRHALEMTIAKLHAHPGISLAVNVSGTTARDPSWLESFIHYIRANHQVARRLIVELTETAALEDFEGSTRFISKLREMGCRVAIDDFGAGFTSFRNLQMLRVDMVKIDGAYVRGLTGSPDNQIFVRTLVDLAKNFRLQTVAEWVGSAEEADLLASFGLDYFQGFHFGEPILEPGWA